MGKRVISAVVMILIFLPILFLGGNIFNIFISILGICSLYELFRVRETKKKLPSVLKIFAYIIVVFLILNNADNLDLQCMLDYKFVSLIIFLFFLPLIFIHDSNKYSLNDTLFLIGSVLFFGLCYNSFIIIRNYDLSYLIYLLLITTMTDTFALFTGMLIGKHKLAPDISPKKTIEGSIGGLFIATFISVAFYVTVINPEVSYFIIIIATMLLSIVGQIGDLIFSMIKRFYNQKDFSNLIPGHGGILDRLDSFIFVLLAFIILFGII